MAEDSKNRTEPERFALSSLIDAMPDAILIVDTIGRIVDANLQAMAMFGYDRDELIGAQVEMLVPEEIRHRHVGEREGYAKRPWVRPMGAGVQTSAVHKGGYEFRVEINLAPYQAPAGLLVVAAIRDVAHQKGEKKEGG